MKIASGNRIKRKIKRKGKSDLIFIQRLEKKSNNVIGINRNSRACDTALSTNGIFLAEYLSNVCR